MNTPLGRLRRYTAGRRASRTGLTARLALLVMAVAVVVAACRPGDLEATRAGDATKQVASEVPPLTAIYEAYAKSLLSENGGVEVDAPTKLTRDEALRRGREFLKTFLPARPVLGNRDQLQALLVRYTADPSYFEYGKLSWFLVVPPTMSLSWGRRFPGPWGVRATAEPDTPQVTYWPCLFDVLLDDETGQFWGGSMCTTGPVGPLVKPSQMVELNTYAEAHGWWPLWLQLHQYDGKPLPDSAVAELKSP